MSKILFHHIPKTAGTSLIEHAEALFGDRVCRARYDHALEPGMIEDPRYVFYHGHFSRAVVQRFRETVPDGFVFTFLRHPQTRVLSQFHNWTDRAKVTKELEVMGAGRSDARIDGLKTTFAERILAMSLDEFLASDHPDVRHVVSNLQAQYVSDEDDPFPLRLEKAVVHALMTYDFVGVQELYAPCLRIVEAKCALPVGSLGGETKANTSDHAKVEGGYLIDAGQRATIEAANAYDFALYHAFYGLLLRDFGAHLPVSAFDIAATIALPRIREASRPVPRSSRELISRREPEMRGSRSGIRPHPAE